MMNIEYTLHHERHKVLLARNGHVRVGTLLLWNNH